jgi:type I restriction enzyme M protein
MSEKNLIKQLGFSPKEKESGIYHKKYANGYGIEVDFDNKTINYGKTIKSDSKTTQNFSQSENDTPKEVFVVLECVDRLLKKGYKPENIILEKTWKLGHQEKGRLDILVTKEDGTAYLMIECKTCGEEFDKELKNIHKDGGQLFSYFQQDKNAELLMLYASKLSDNGIISETETIKIEDAIRNSGSVKEAHKLWNKSFAEMDFWNKPAYSIEAKKITKGDLNVLTEDEGKKLFHGFATILRKHSVSDKPNAFNVIFNLFLAKLYDEAKPKNKELDFYWREDDDPVDFQVRLYNLHKEGLLAFLKKEIEGIEDFKISDQEELRKAKKKFLKFNKLFDIKSVFNDDDFEQNHRVLKEVVKLIENYQIRYPRKQRHLSDFFELLLTTGLKQEAGQYFTPPPVTKFITKSLPLQSMIEKAVNNEDPKLPAVIDYAAGSGHFITEIMEEYQDIINNLKTDENYPETAIKEINGWKVNPYSWAAKYIYGIEKDYRLVKVAKVGCYFYGDGLAQIVHGDGLDSFGKSKSYVGLLKDNATKPQFSVLVSNPPYSVDGVKDDLEYIGAQNDFTLFKNLTDNSSEIEALFVERAAQLLKENGIAGIVLPSSILSNGGIYAKAREIILQNFDIAAITQLGGNTFMATNTNTVVLFLRKRSETNVNRIKDAAYQLAENYPKTREDLTINGIEKPVRKYLDHTRETEINPEKFYYFVLNYHQKTVVVKTGGKEDEKRFLGYKIEHRRGNEGYHAIQGRKTIDECTRLFDDKNPENPEKASSYIYKAFNNEYPAIDATLKDNVFYADLIDMLTFDREKFDKNISLSIKKKVKIESRWDIVKINQLVDIVRGASPRPIKEFITDESTGINWIKIGDVKPNSKYITETEEKITPSGAEKSRLVNEGDFILSNSMSFGRPYIMKTKGCIHDGWLLMTNFDSALNKDFFYYILSAAIVQNQFILAASGGTSVDNLNIEKVSHIQIPLPPLEIQQKIVAEIEVFEKKEEAVKGKIEKSKEKIEQLFLEADSKANDIFRLSDDIFDVSIGKRVIEADLSGKGTIPVYSANVFEPFGYIDTYLIADFSTPSVLWGIDGDWMVHYMPANKPFYPTDHCGVLRIKSDKILPKYLAWLLNKEGLQKGFSRTLRASIDRIQGLNIKAPPLSEQQKIVVEIEKMEAQIQELQKQLAETSKQKESVLKKYL